MKGTESDEYLEEILLENGLDGTAFFTGDNFSSAILGYTNDGNLVYSYEKMIEWFMENSELSFTDAKEYIDYNVVRSVDYMGDTKPIIVYNLIY